ncbi:MAG: MFS transporter [Actinomycetota bacterium]|nr:MFS transporter [Actinomycetota bacterium]
MVAAQPAATASVEVEGVLRAGGFTRFHRRAVAVTGVAWTFVAMEILLVGFTVPLFTALWDLSGSFAGWIAASALAGSLVGSLTLGRIADRIGRRQIFLASILWYAVFTALTAFAWGPGSVSAFRFLAGIGLGGLLVVDPSMLAEYLPPQKRGRFLVFLDFFWPVGLLLATGLSWLFLEQVGGDWGWRYLFLVASFPAFLAFVARLSLPESPYFLARRGRKEEAARVLTRITGKPVAADSLVTAAEAPSSVAELGGSQLRRSTLMIVAVWIALNISYYGLFLWLPFVLAGDTYELDVYLLLALSALSQFPGYAAAIWLVEVWGRRRTLSVFLILGGLAAFAFALADSTPVYVAALFFVGFFNLGAWGAVYPYTSELFPTRLRSTAFGLVEGVGKGAAIGGPYLFGYLLDVTGDTVWSLAFVALVMAAGGLIVLSGRETRGAKLA